MNFSKTKTVTIFVIIISVIYSACCAVSEQRDDLGERYVYPYTPHYGWNGEEVVPDGAKFDFSAVSYYKFSAEKLPVYEDIYSLYEKTENGMTGEYLNTAIDEEYKALCKRNAETYLSLCEP